MLHIDHEDDIKVPFSASQIKILVMDTQLNYGEYMKFRLHVLGFHAMQFQQQCKHTLILIQRVHLIRKGVVKLIKWAIKMHYNQFNGCIKLIKVH